MPALQSCGGSELGRTTGAGAYFAEFSTCLKVQVSRLLFTELFLIHCAFVVLFFFNVVDFTELPV